MYGVDIGGEWDLTTFPPRPKTSPDWEPAKDPCFGDRVRVRAWGRWYYGEVVADKGDHYRVSLQVGRIQYRHALVLLTQMEVRSGPESIRSARP